MRPAFAMPTTKVNSVWVIGLGRQYPQYSITQDQFADLIMRLYPEACATPTVQKLLRVNKSTKIFSRPTIFDQSTWTKDDAAAPAIDELSHIFRTLGVDLTVAACNKAIKEARITPIDITHVVAVTCTDQGSPGYDLFVSHKLQLRPGVQRSLLHGVGCAGGLSALREAANLAVAASSRRQPARILVFATELCSLFLRAELKAAFQNSGVLNIAPLLFSDGSAALVVCNGIALAEKQRPIYEIQEYDSAILTGTQSHMSYNVSPKGMLVTITKDVPKATVAAVGPMFSQVCSTKNASVDPKAYDWAVHPGGASILQGVQEAMGLSDNQIRASLDVYHKFGNSSSPTVLIVLDKLRHMGRGKDNVIATSFGPGLMIEMCRMTRCRDAESEQEKRPGLLFKAHRLCMSLTPSLFRLNKTKQMGVGGVNTSKRL
ncbi:hypothetical protein PMIN04_001649 [Paraphaeosphaeria minitans]